MAKDYFEPTNTNQNIDYYMTMRKISTSIHNLDMEKLTDIKKMISTEINKYTSPSNTKEKGSGPLHLLLSLFNQREIICFLSLQHFEIFNRLLESQNRIFCETEIDLQQKLINYLKENYNNNKLPVSNMASGFCMSVRKLQKCSNQLINLKPSELLKVYRVIKSCVQIITTNHGLDKISADNGFGFYSSFHRSFKDCIHITPKRFKRQFSHLLYLFP